MIDAAFANDIQNAPRRYLYGEIIMLNRTRVLLLVLVCLVGLATIGAGAAETINTNALRKQQFDRLQTFFVAKEKQAKALAASEQQELLPEVQALFKAGTAGKWETVTNLYDKLSVKHNAAGKLPRDEKLANARYWEIVNEAGGACDQLMEGTPRFIQMWEHDIIESIPPGSIYFGGTDPGRFLVTAFCKSHINGEPFFTVTQNRFADSYYLNYLRFMYGSKITMLSDEDSTKAFNEYLADAQKRLKDNQLKPGEDVTMTNGRVQVTGQVAVMSINALLAKAIFDKNPGREMFVEESFPLDWMYPYLEPHGMIMKLNRFPLPEISEDAIQQDRIYWHPRIREMIGDWLTQRTTLQEIADFSIRVYGHTNLTEFKGDPAFATNDNAQKMFSKLRSSMGGLYAWRANNAKSKNEKERMQRAADFAYRQAIALCPYSPEAVYRYVQLLTGQQRYDDAILVVTTCSKIIPEDQQIQSLLKQLKQISKTQRNKQL